MAKKKMEVVGMIKVDGEWKRQDEVPPEVFKEAVEKAVDRAMKNIGFERIKTA